MAIPIGPTTLKNAAKVLPVIGPVVVNEAKKKVEERKRRQKAHAKAWQSGGRVGRVEFDEDETTRWVVVDADGVPIAAYPAYRNGDRDALRAAMEGVNLDRCMKRPDPELREEKRRAKEEKRRADEERKQQKREAKKK